MKQLLSILFCLLFANATVLNAQQNGQENQKIYEKLKNVKEHCLGNDKKALKTLDSLKPILEKKLNDSLLGFYFRIYSKIKINQLDKKAALNAIIESITYYENAKNQKGIVQASIDKGNIYFMKGEIKWAINQYITTLKLAQKNKLEYESAILYKNIGLVFFNQGKLNEALANNTKSVQIFLKLNKEKEVAETYTNIGNCYYNNYDSKNALLNYKKAYAISLKIKDSVNQAKLYNNMGAVYIDDVKDTTKGLSYLTKALNLKIKLKDQEGLIFQYENIASVYVGQKKYDDAKKYLDKAFEMAKKAQNTEEIKEIYEIYSLVYAGKKEYQNAYTYHKLYSKIKDTLLNIENLKVVKDINTKYETSEKEKIILKQQAEVKKRNFYLVGFALFSFLIALLGYLLFRQQKLKTAQQAQEFELNSAISKIENQSKLQEQRLSISRDLHDNIGAQLTFIISSVDNIKYAFDITNEKLDSKLTNISSFAKDTIVELRDTIWAMNSNEISFEDLEIRINNYIEKAKEAKDQISFSFAIDSVLKTQKLTSVQGMNIYRTIQEAVNNAIKYANASVITINAKQLENQLKIIIQDNGLGFDETSIEKGNGLKNMQKRIEEIGGEFYLSSSNEGTRIEILLKNNVI